jgi:hypothetical protein
MAALLAGAAPAAATEYFVAANGSDGQAGSTTARHVPGRRHHRALGRGEIRDKARDPA